MKFIALTVGIFLAAIWMTTGAVLITRGAETHSLIGLVGLLMVCVFAAGVVIFAEWLHP